MFPKYQLSKDWVWLILSACTWIRAWILKHCRKGESTGGSCRALSKCHAHKGGTNGTESQANSCQSCQDGPHDRLWTPKTVPVTCRQRPGGGSRGRGSSTGSGSGIGGGSSSSSSTNTTRSSSNSSSSSSCCNSSSLRLRAKRLGCPGYMSYSPNS